MAEAQTDILVYLVHNGSQMQAECLAQLNPSDDLLADFQRGCFFQAESLELGLELVDSESGSKVDYTRWREHDGVEGSGPSRFRVKPDVLSFSRLVDSSSPVLMQMCLSLAELDRVVLVKRHSVGGTTPLGFLRLEMEDVTIQSVKWDDGHAVKESCTFTFQSLAMRFQQRRPNGSALPERSGSWTSAAKPSK